MRELRDACDHLLDTKNDRLGGNRIVLGNIVADFNQLTNAVAVKRTLMR